MTRAERPTVRPAIASAAELIERFDIGATLFSSPHHTLLGEGALSTLSLPAGAADAVSQQLSDHLTAVDRWTLNDGEVRVAPSVAVGAVPFDGPWPVHLVVPKRVTWGRPRIADSRPVTRVAPSFGPVRPVPAPAEYVAAVRRAVQELQDSDLVKVVLARSLQLEAQAPIDLPALVRQLAAAIRTGYLFAVPLPALGRHLRSLTGVSPELLVSRFGDVVTANPLAGSIPRSADPVEDERRRRELASSAKDLHEHAVVREAVDAALRPYCRELNVPAEPSVIATPTLWHLSTRITGRITDPSVTALQLGLALHPTPAVCGSPTLAARAFIGTLEPFDRSYYAGLVGWCDSRGDGEWAVTLRCAEVEDRALSLFAGAGIVADSDPDSELAETSAKFNTFLAALGVAEPAHEARTS